MVSPAQDNRCSRRNGFTLVEVLVVISIVGILMALLMPAVQSARASARRVQCQGRLHQLGLALHNYHDVHGIFPPGTLAMGSSFPLQTGWGWEAMLLPHLEQAALYNQLDFHIGNAAGSNRELIAHPLNLLSCPSDAAPQTILAQLPGEEPLQVAAGNYCGVEPILKAMSRTRIAHVIDGTSQTLLVGERVYQPGEGGGLEYTSSWCGRIASDRQYAYQSIAHLPTTQEFPPNLSFNVPHCFSSRHSGGVQFALADGSARLVSEFIDRAVYEALGTPNGGESFSF